MMEGRTRIAGRKADAASARTARWRRVIARKLLGLAGRAVLGIGILGALFTFAFSGSFGTTISAAPWIAWIEAAPAPDDQPEGAHVLLAGIVAADSAPLRGRFVAYVEERKSDGRSGSTMVVDALRRSAFAVDTPNGRYDLTSANYAFSLPMGWWFSGFIPSMDVLVKDWDHKDHREKRTSAGQNHISVIVNGLPVIVIGRKAGGQAIRPRFVLAGTRETLLAQLKSPGQGFWFWAKAFAAVGLGVGLALLILWSIYTIVLLALRKPRFRRPRP